MKDEKKESGLKNHTIIFMVTVALFFDALQWLLAFIFMGWLAGIFAGLTFYVWFKTYGISFMKPKRFVTFGGSFIIELIPVVGDVLPTWTAAIVYLALDSKLKKVVGQIPGGNLATNAMSGNKRNLEVARNKRPIDVNAQNLEVARNKNKAAMDINAHNLRVTQKKNLDADVTAYNLRVARGENKRGFVESE